MCFVVRITTRSSYDRQWNIETNDSRSNNLVASPRVNRGTTRRYLSKPPRSAPFAPFRHILLYLETRLVVFTACMTLDISLYLETWLKSIWLVWVIKVIHALSKIPRRFVNSSLSPVPVLGACNNKSSVFGWWGQEWLRIGYELSSPRKHSSARRSPLREMRWKYTYRLPFSTEGSGGDSRVVLCEYEDTDHYWYRRWHSSNEHNNCNWKMPEKQLALINNKLL